MTSETTTTTEAQAVEVGCIDKKSVITTDGRNIGDLTGAYIDTSSWMVTGLLVEINKDVVDELRLKKPMLRTAKAQMNTSLVRAVGDAVQLNVPITGLAGNLTGVE